MRTFANNADIEISIVCQLYFHAIFVISGKINKGFRQLVIIGNFQDMSPPNFVLPQEFIGVNSEF